MSTIARRIVTRPPTTSSLPQAAERIMADLRASGPCTWKELWVSGLGSDVIPPGPPPAIKPGQSKSWKTNNHLKPSGFGSAPEDHPFRSVTYFKKHILKNLAQQGIIEQVHIARPTSVVSSSDLTPIRKSLVEAKQLPRTLPTTSTETSSPTPPPTTQESGHKVSEFLWTLPRALAVDRVELAKDPKLSAQRARIESHISSLLSAQNNHDIVQLARERRKNLATRTAEYRESLIAKRGIDPRTNERAYKTQDEMMVWEGRKEYLSTEKERLHLNKRRGLGRSEKERRDQGWLEGLTEAREEGRRLAARGH